MPNNESQWWREALERVLPASSIRDDDDRPVTSLYTRAKIIRVIKFLIAESERRKVKEIREIVDEKIAKIQMEISPENDYTEEAQKVVRWALSLLKADLHTSLDCLKDE